MARFLVHRPKLPLKDERWGEWAISDQSNSTLTVGQLWDSDSDDQDVSNIETTRYPQESSDEGSYSRRRLRQYRRSCGSETLEIQSLGYNPSTSSRSSTLLSRSLPFHVAHFDGFYNYEPLPRGHIRLIELGTRSEGQVQCSIFTAPFEREVLEYEALSYEWGGDDLQEAVLVDGRPVHVTSNLWEALKGLRRDHRRILWVDALCINQHDAAEKKDQVGRMDRIYKFACRVLCWLGRGDAVSDAAMKTIKRWGATPAEWRGIPTATWPLEEARLVRVVGRNNLESTRRFLTERSYWNRVWIRHELTWARKIHIYCHNENVSWHMLSRVWTHLDTMMSPSPCKCLKDTWPESNALRNIMRWRNDLREVNDPHWLLHELIYARPLRATDPRDKVFCLLSLFHSTSIADSSRLAVDYTLSPFEAYLEVFKYCVWDDKHRLRGSGCLNILCASEPCPGYGLDLPGWLPDWSFEGARRPLFMAECGASASRGMDPEVFLRPDNRVLRCKGFEIGHVQCIGLEDDGTQDISVLHSWFDMAKPHLHARNGRLDLTPFIRTMQGGQGYGGIVSYLVYYEKWKKVLGGELWETDPFMWSPIRVGRRFAISGRGELLLVPANARKGDCICIIFGCSAPVLMRNRSGMTCWDKDFVGECYVYGNMKGEALNDESIRRTTYFDIH